MMKHLLIVPLCFFFLAAMPIQAQITPLGAQFQVNTYTTDRQGSPAIAMDSLGNSVIVWGSMGEDGDAGGIFARRYAADGTASNPFQVNLHTAGNQSMPAIASNKWGDFVIVWVSNQNGSYNSIYGRRYNAAGVPQDTIFRVNTTTLGQHIAPKIAMDAIGHFAVVWEYSDSTHREVYAQRFNPQNIKQGIEFQVNTHVPLEQSHPSIAMNATGNFVVAWQSVEQDSSGYGVYAQRYNANGTPAGSEFRANTQTFWSQQLPSVSMGDQGNFIIVWQWYVLQQNYGRGQLYDAQGTPQGSEMELGTSTPVTFPIVKLHKDDSFVIGWMGRIPQTPWMFSYVRWFDRLGVGQMSWRVNSYTNAEAYIGGIGMDAKGNFTITWSSGDPTITFTEVFAQRYSLQVGVNEVAKSTQVQVNPTFVSDVCQVVGAKAYKILDLTGKVVYRSEEPMNQEIKMQLFVAGMYLICGEDLTGMPFVTKIVKL